MTVIVNAELLKRLYVDEGKPMHEVADKMGISVGTVYNYIHKYDIPSRPPHMGFLGHKQTEEAKAKCAKANLGRKVSMETRKRMSEALKKGGIGFKKKRTDGYISIYFPDHPKSSVDGYVMEHVLVMEALVGRHLYDDECVHHINGKRDDNRKENLMLMTKSEHMSMHSKMRWEKRRNDLSINGVELAD